MQTTKIGISKPTVLGTTSGINQLELSLSISNQPEITSLPAVESGAVETKFETSLPEVIEPEFPNWDTL